MQFDTARVLHHVRVMAENMLQLLAEGPTTDYVSITETQFLYFLNNFMQNACNEDKHYMNFIYNTAMYEKLSPVFNSYGPAQAYGDKVYLGMLLTRFWNDRERLLDPTPRWPSGPLAERTSKKRERPTTHPRTNKRPKFITHLTKTGTI